MASSYPCLSSLNGDFPAAVGAYSWPISSAESSSEYFFLLDALQTRLFGVPLWSTVATKHSRVRELAGQECGAELLLDSERRTCAL